MAILKGFSEGLPSAFIKLIFLLKIKKDLNKNGLVQPQVSHDFSQRCKVHWTFSHISLVLSRAFHIASINHSQIHSSLTYLLQMLVKLFFSNRIIDILYNLNKYFVVLNTFKSILKLFDFMYHCNRLHRLMGRNGNVLFFRRVTVVHFTEQNRISTTAYCNRCEMVCKIGLTNWNAKIALLRAPMVVTYYVKLFRTGADRHNSILMSLVPLGAETMINFDCSNFDIDNKLLLQFIWNCCKQEC